MLFPGAAAHRLGIYIYIYIYIPTHLYLAQSILDIYTAGHAATQLFHAEHPMCLKPTPQRLPPWHFLAQFIVVISHRARPGPILPRDETKSGPTPSSTQG